MPDVVWSEQASNDLDSLTSFLKARNPSAAATYVEDLRQSCLKLEEFPESGRRYDDRYRILVARNHLIFYRFAPTQDRVTIVTILDGRREIGRLL